MALGAGLAFLMAVSLTGCEMDRMDQEADQPLFVETRRSYDGEWRAGKMALGAGLAFLMAVSLTGCEMDRMDQEADQPLFVETRRSYDGEWQDQRCLLRSRWDGLYVPVDGWDTLKDGLDQYNAEVSQETGERLFVETRRSYDGEWQDQRCLLRSRWDGLYVPVDGWDTLKDGLDQYNAEVSQETGERFKENLSLVREDPPESGQEYYIEREIRVQRADSRIVSFWDMDSSYVGGAHGSIMPME